MFPTLSQFMAKNTIPFRTKFIRQILEIFVLATQIQHTLSQDQVEKFTLSPPIVDSSNAPYLSADLLLSQTKKARGGLSVCLWFSLISFKRPTVVFSLKDVDSGTWEVSLGKYLGGVQLLVNIKVKARGNLHGPRQPRSEPRTNIWRSQAGYPSSSLGILPNGLLFRTRGSTVAIPRQILPLSMNHICLSVSTLDVSLFLNGKSFHVSLFQGSEILEQNLEIYLGGGEQWPDITPSYAGKLYVNDNSFVFLSTPKGSFIGQIINPSVWESALSPREIFDHFNCDFVIKPLPEIQWTLFGLNHQKSIMNKTEICEKKNFDYLFLSKKLTFEGNQDSCKKLQLSLMSPNAGIQYSQLIDAVQPFHNKCGKEKWYAWLQPMVDNSDGPTSTSNRCEALTTSGQEILACEEQLCSGCQLTTNENLFILRGICPLSKVDLTFQLQKNEGKLGFYFYGIERYNITHDGEMWLLKDEASDIAVASTPDTIHPIGVREWTFQTEFCGKKKGEVVRASLSSCNSDEAICGDGSCVSLTKRCDSYPDCFDAADEEECFNIRPSSVVATQSPPEPSPTKVETSISILRIPSVPPRGYFTLLLEIKLSWSDPRIIVANLPPGQSFLLPPQNVIVWRPNLSILSPGDSASLQAINIADDNSFSFVSPRTEGTTWTANTGSDPLPDTRETPFRDVLYAGSNTTLTLTEFMTQHVDCDFDFSFFPFDQQLCRLSMVFSTWPISRLVLQESPIGRYTGPARLLHYTVGQTTVVTEPVNIDDKVYSGITLSINLSRRPSLYVLTVYLPSVLLIFIDCSTLWMMCGNGTVVRVGVNCIVLVVFLLQWILMISGSPEIGHLTAIDVWLCFCVVQSILNLAVHVLLEVFKDETEPDPFSRMASRMNSAGVRDVKSLETRRWSIYDGILMKMAHLETRKQWSVPYWILFIARVVSPILLLFFNIIYWPFVLHFRRNELP